MAEPLDLPPPPDGTPAGPNMEADRVDQSFGELERAARGKPESQFGNAIEAAQPPDWAEVVSLAEGLLGKTRDLRVMALLGMARVNQGDMPGFATVLATVREHLDTMWEHVHPELDPEDDIPNDPQQRSYTLALLAEPARVLRAMRDMPLARMPRGRPISWRDIAVLNGEIEPQPGRPKIGAAEIRDTFAKTDQAALRSLTEALESVDADLVAIPKVFEAKAGHGAPEFKDLLRLVRSIRKEIDHYAADGPAEEAVEEADGADEAPAAAVAGPGRAPRAVATIRAIAALDSREDALLALELASAYFRTHEPSSPLPLLIDRAVRLAPLPFMEILRDLAPDGLMQAQTIAGTAPE